MPHANEISGVYKIINTETSQCYVGQSCRVKGRLSGHFGQLQKGKHTNLRLQNAYKKYKPENFRAELIAVVENASDRDTLENALIAGRVGIKETVFYNIAPVASCPMQGRKHKADSVKMMQDGMKAAWKDPYSGYKSPEYSAKLSNAQKNRRLSSEEFRDKIKFLLENDHLSHKELAKILRLKKKTIPVLIERYGHTKGAL